MDIRLIANTLCRHLALGRSSSQDRPVAIADCKYALRASLPIGQTQMKPRGVLCAVYSRCFMCCVQYTLIRAVYSMSMAEAEPPPAMKPSEEAGWQLPQVPQLQHPNEVRSRPSPHHRAPSQHLPSPGHRKQPWQVLRQDTTVVYLSIDLSIYLSIY